MFPIELMQTSVPHATTLSTIRIGPLIALALAVPTAAAYSLTDGSSVTMVSPSPNEATPFDVATFADTDTPAALVLFIETVTS